MLGNKKILELKNLIETAELALKQGREIIESFGIENRLESKLEGARFKKEETGGGKIIEGVFDGEKMIGPDGKSYSVPANYASKSRLVEGDLLKLVIENDGRFIYKQTAPVERNRLKGRLVYDNENEGFRVMTENGRSYKILTASATYFKAAAGDEAIILVPSDGLSDWAALENLVKADKLTEGAESMEAEDDSRGQGVDKDFTQSEGDLIKMTDTPAEESDLLFSKGEEFDNEVLKQERTDEVPIEFEKSGSDLENDGQVNL